MKDHISFLNILRKNLRSYSMFFVLGIIFLIFAVITQYINTTPRNITNIFIQNSYILLLATGMVLIIITGNIDLSVGSLCAFTGAVSVLVYNLNIGIIPTIIITMLIGSIIGAFQGASVAYLRVPSFIVTLAGMLLFRGLTYIITDISPITPKDDTYKQIVSGYLFENETGPDTSLIFTTAIIIAIIMCIFASYNRRKKIRYGFSVLPVQYFIVRIVLLFLVIGGLAFVFSQYHGIPNIVVLMSIVIGIFVFITKKTVLGRHIYAVGGNAAAAKLSGINSERIVFLVFVIMGTLAGLSGVVFTAYLNSALPQAGQLFELEAIAAAFIGGASATGGIGTIIGAVTGALVMGTINNGMSLMNLGAEYQLIVKALVLLLAVWYDLYSRKKTVL